MPKGLPAFIPSDLESKVRAPTRHPDLLDDLAQQARSRCSSEICRTTISVHRTVLREVQALAIAEGLSVNSLVLSGLDMVLRRRGRPGVNQLLSESRSRPQET